MTNSYYCPSCKEWVYRGYNDNECSTKGGHMRIKHGWCNICDRNTTRRLLCILKHKCRKDKRLCLLRYETPSVALRRHTKEGKHRWRKDIVIGTSYHDLKEPDIDRPCAKCGWSVNISEPHYKGSYIREQDGVTMRVLNDIRDKPVFDDSYDEKPRKKDYMKGARYDKPRTGKPFNQEAYDADIVGYKNDLKSFKEELSEWKDEVAQTGIESIDRYSGVNHYHMWCKNE